MTPTSGTAQLQDVAFRIFDLPIELRYRVYILLRTNKLTTDHGLRITSFQLRAVRLVCKQMRDEYDDEARPRQCFIIQCCPENFSTIWNTIRNYHSHQIGTIRRVYLSMEVTLPAPTDDDWNDLRHVSANMHRCVEELAGWSNVRTTIYTMLQVCVNDESILAKDIGYAHSFLQGSSTKFGDVRVAPQLILELPLLSANLNNVDNQKEEDLVDDAPCHEDNYIWYEARPCSDEDSWNGLTLTTISVGAKSFDELMAKAKSEHTKALEVSLNDDFFIEDDCSEDEDFQGESLDA
ncbi:hypothetical protein LTR56_020908 [Elasticomyces elasticus]|nr:hypothetical protein LTR56_020908 [Elasticomyces elasticus]KAK4920240.1 hypothetical protein LTR49_012191 [Elasticomyces elasticus]KAK5749839.1 hypothetical protein LTS12_020129 [Elasticomyces elasticus]